MTEEQSKQSEESSETTVSESADQARDSEDRFAATQTDASNIADVTEPSSSVSSPKDAEAESGANDPIDAEEEAESSISFSGEDNETAEIDGFDSWFKRSFSGIPLEAAKAAVATYKESHSSFGYTSVQLQDRLTDQQLLQTIDAIDEWEEIERLQNQMLAEIEQQGKISDELRNTIKKTFSLNVLEDIFLPYKIKKKTLASQAREAGLEKLSNWIWNKGHDLPTEVDLQGESIDEIAAPFCKEGTPYATTEAVIKAVSNILVERIAETQELRSAVRRSVFRQSRLRSVKGPKAKEKSKYFRYFDYREPIGSLKKTSASARYLLLRKGWIEDELVLSFERPNTQQLEQKFVEHACTNTESIGADLLIKAAKTALNTNVYTAIENEASRLLKKTAETNLLYSLGLSLKKKLLEPPFGAKSVLGVDHTANKPTCNLAVVNPEGKFLGGTKFEINKIKEDEEAKKAILETLSIIKIEAIAVSHGPQAKAIRTVMQELLQEANLDVPVYITYDKNSSIYASSAAGKEELSDQTNNIRKAAFVALHFQNPLAALVKLDPKYLNFGQYQYDINHNRLQQVFRRIIELAVAKTGVNINLASPYLLSYVPNISVSLSKAIVEARDKGTSFADLENLKSVEGMTDSALMHAKPVFELFESQTASRAAYEPFVYDASVTDFESLQKDQKIRGVVTNITTFGAFVDIGLSSDGLVPINEIAQWDMKHPENPLVVGDQLEIWVTSIDLKKRQLAFTTLSPEERAAKREKAARNAKNKPGAKNRRAGFAGKRGFRKAGEPVEGEKREFKKRRPTKDSKKDRPEKKESKPKKLRRDPKTGAIIKDQEGTWGKRDTRGKFKTKAKTQTFNPFASLGSLVGKTTDSDTSEE